MKRRNRILRNKKNRVRTAAIAVLAFFCLLAAGSVWQYVKQKEELASLTPPGRLYNINSHAMHLYATGQGDTTVVFTTGSGTPCAYTDFYNLQHKLQPYARTVSYDRPGFGWSESTDIPRTIDTQAEELHELLRAAEERPPYILAGHSLASLEVIRYAQMYPGEVKGIVLLDGGNPEYYASNSEFLSVALNRTAAFIRMTGIARAFGNFGIRLPFVGENVRYRSLPEEAQAADRVMYYTKLGNKDNLNAIANLNENAETVIKGGPLKDIPLIILSSDGDKKWNESQRKLAEWSNQSKQETLSGAGHYIHWTNEETVIDILIGLINR